MKATEDDLICLICGKTYHHLGSHIARSHKITAREYKTRFCLPYNMALISDSIKEKKRLAFEKDRSKYLKNILSDTTHRFKKGRTGQRRISAREREAFIERIKEVNENRKPEICPVCGMEYQNLDSHLYSKHKLLRINED